MIRKTKGIVLHSIKYGDTSIIAYLYTEEFGRHSFLFKGIRSKKSKIRSNIIHPLSFLILEAYIKERNDLSLVKEAEPCRIFQNFPYDSYKSAQAMFIADVLYRCLRQEEQDEKLFRFLTASIEYLDLVEEGSANFHLFFLVKLTRHLGLYPTPKDDADEMVFDMQEGVYQPDVPSHIDYINPMNSAILKRILNTGYENLKDLKMNREMRNDLLGSILKFYSIHIEGISNLKSYTVLRDLFQ